MKLTKDNVLEKWGDVKIILSDKKEFIDLGEDSFIPFANLYDEFDEDMKKDFDQFLDTANKLLKAKEEKVEEKKKDPKYKVGDWVIVRVHTPEGVKESFPVKITDVTIYPDGNVFYRLDGGVDDISEGEIIRKTSAPKPKTDKIKDVAILWSLAAGTYTLSIDHKEIKDSERKSLNEFVEYMRINHPELLKREDVIFQLKNYGWGEKKTSQKPKNDETKKTKKVSAKDAKDYETIKANLTEKPESLTQSAERRADANGYGVDLEKEEKAYKQCVKQNDFDDMFIILEYLEACNFHKEREYFLKQDWKGLKKFLNQIEKPASQPKSEKPKKQEFTGEYVDVIPEEVKLIKRYLWMNGRTMAEIKRHKSNNPNTLLNVIQKAITEKRIRKTSPYADEIMAIQKTLVQICNGDKNFTSGKFESKNADALKAIVDKYKVSDYRKVSNAYIKNQDKTNKKKEAENLLKRMDKAVIPDERKDEFAEMKKALKAYIDGKTEKIEATERQLRGLYGILNNQQRGKLQGVDDLNADHQGVVSTTDFVNARFNKIGFTGRWLSLIGDPCENFKMMVYGESFNGKSTFCLLFAKYLSQSLGKKVLYIASEEKFGYTLQEKIKRLNVANDNFYIADRIPLDLGEYDVVFFDSVNDLGIDHVELKEIADGIASVAIFQCTKDGDYRGGSEFKHDADVVIKVENMVATIDGKNRFGGIVGNEFAVR